MILPDQMRSQKIIYGTHKMSTKNMTDAITVGYLVFDTATGYQNANLLKEAINKCDQEVYIITKFNPRDFKTGIEQSVSDHIKDLGQEPNMILLHSPLGTNELNIKAFNDLKAIFKNKPIGVSNFSIKQIQALIDAQCKPDMISVEFHPFYQPMKLVEYCREHEIDVTCYRALSKGSVNRNSVIQKIADTHKCSPAQIVLRWISDKGLIPIISSSNLVNQQQNLQLETIKLTESETFELNNLNRENEGSTCMIKYCDHDY
jgi:diketogulonate reductase-like aldo/keto reductase